MSRARTLVTLLRCEVTSISRCRPFRIGTCLYVLLLTVYALGWGETNTFARAHTTEAVLLALVLPWMAVRCTSAERGDDLVAFSAILGVRPSQILAARALAVAVASSLVVLSGAPVAILASRIAAASVGDLSRMLAMQLLLAIAATIAFIVAQQFWAGRARVWMAVGVVTAAIAVVAEMVR